MTSRPSARSMTAHKPANACSCSRMLMFAQAHAGCMHTLTRAFSHARVPAPCSREGHGFSAYSRLIWVL
eukprot:152232-Pleurochrysis_carterae.AAC.1